MMALNSLLDIPSELIGYILSYLSAHDIISCQCTCRTLYYLVCNNTSLRYLVQMERFGVTDDMNPGLSYPERLNLLEKREEAWKMLDFRRSVQITVPFHSTSIYDFTGGAFLLGTRLYGTSHRPTAGYSYMPLPSLSDPPDQRLDWVKLDLGVQILDVGLAVHEHDLIAALTVCVSSTFLVIHKLIVREVKGERTWSPQPTDI
jgi:F-box domain